jgi:hypothetical protein
MIQTTAICLKGDGCRYGRSWHPDNDTIHYCDVCKVWLHRECATKWNGNLDNRKPYTELFKDRKSVNTKALRLCLAPIVRTNWHRQTVWGVESIITLVREYSGAPELSSVFRDPDFWQDLLHHIVMNTPLAAGMTIERLEVILPDVLLDFTRQYSLDKTTKLTCPLCQRWV